MKPLHDCAYLFQSLLSAGADLPDLVLHNLRALFGEGGERRELVGGSATPTLTVTAAVTVNAVTVKVFVTAVKASVIAVKVVTAVKVKVTVANAIRRLDARRPFQRSPFRPSRAVLRLRRR